MKNSKNVKSPHCCDKSGNSSNTAKGRMKNSKKVTSPPCCDKSGNKSDNVQVEQQESAEKMILRSNITLQSVTWQEQLERVNIIASSTVSDYALRTSRSRTVPYSTPRTVRSSTMSKTSRSRTMSDSTFQTGRSRTVPNSTPLAVRSNTASDAETQIGSTSTMSETSHGSTMSNFTPQTDRSSTGSDPTSQTGNSSTMPVTSLSSTMSDSTPQAGRSSSVPDSTSQSTSSDPSFDSTRQTRHSSRSGQNPLKNKTYGKLTHCATRKKLQFGNARQGPLYTANATESSHWLTQPESELILRIGRSKQSKGKEKNTSAQPSPVVSQIFHKDDLASSFLDQGAPSTESADPDLDDSEVVSSEESVLPASFQDRSRELSKHKSEGRKGNRKISKYGGIQANDPPRTREIDAKRQKASGKSKTNVLRKDHNSITRPDGNRIRCDDCGRLFESQQDLNQHFEKVHARNGPYECTQCGHLLKTRRVLVQHFKIHGERKHKCILCDKRFLTRNRLNSHMRTHTKERPYACHQCGCKFSSKDYLAVHSKFHSSRKSYECGQCGKKFAIAAYLKQHMRMHTGEKFPCEICGRLLSQRFSLLRHMKLHSGVKAYECTHCGTSFTLKAYLIAHERTHTGEKPYTCSVCRKKFSQGSAMVRHEKKHMTS